MRLSQMKENDVGKITSVSNSLKIKNRLFDMGFITGQKIKCTNIGLKGSPIAYNVRGCTVALRKSDADMIGVVL